MKKLPVDQTIAFAYSFVFVHIGSIVSVTWMPALLSSAVDYLVRSYAGPPQEDASVGFGFAIWLAGTLTALFLSSVATVGVTRAALGMTGGDTSGLPVGWTELRMFAAKLRFWIGAGVLIVLAALVTSLAFTLAGVPLDGGTELSPTPGALVAGLIGWVAFGYAAVTMLRIGFLLPAIVVAEPNGGLQRSHNLSRGNVWRLAAVVIALGAPIVLLIAAAGYAILRASLGADYPRVLEEASMLDLMQRGERAVQENLLAWEAFNAVTFILASGLLYSGSAYAYRSLMATERAPDANTNTGTNE